MNNAVDFGIKRINANIPMGVLDAALAGDAEFGLECAIKDKIIAERVIPDCNLSGGKTIQIRILSEYNEPLTNEYYSVYRIPAAIRDNRDIIEVHRVQYDPRNRPSYFAYTGEAQQAAMFQADPRIHMTAFDKAQQIMLSSKTGIGASSSVPHVELLQGDLIRLHPSPQTHIDWVLTCRVAYDKDMANLNSEAIDRFADLCIIAAKTYCYNKLIMNIDKGFIYHGSELSVIKDIISQWSDLGDKYTEALNKFLGANSLDLQRISALIAYAI